MVSTKIGAESQKKNPIPPHSWIAGQFPQIFKMAFYWLKPNNPICLSSSDRTCDRAIDFDRAGQSFTGSAGQAESASRLAGSRRLRFVTEVFNAARRATIAILAPVNLRHEPHPTQHNGCSYVHHLRLRRREGPAPRQRPLPARADRHHGQRFRPQARKCSPDASDAIFHAGRAPEARSTRAARAGLRRCGTIADRKRRDSIGVRSVASRFRRWVARAADRSSSDEVRDGAIA